MGQGVLFFIFTYQQHVDLPRLLAITNVFTTHSWNLYAPNERYTKTKLCNKQVLMLLFSLWASWPPSTAAYEEISLYISGWTYQSDSFARNGVAKGYCGHCHQQYGESSAWHGNLSTQEHPYLEQTRYIKEESTLAVLEDNLPHIKLDSMIMGTIEMELIEVYMIQQLSHCETIASSLIAIAPNIGQ